MNRLKQLLSRLANVQRQNSGQELPYLLSIIILIFFLAISPIPKDDLLRDLIAWKYNYDYAQLYINAPLLPPYNQYFLFDKLLGFICKHLGLMYSLRMVQLSAIIIYLVPIFILVKSQLAHRSDKHIIATLAVAITFCACGNRILIARPEVFFAAWVVWGIVAHQLNKDIYKGIWYLTGLALIGMYWLSFIYIPMALWVFNKTHNKVIALLGLLVATILIWQSISNGAWLHSQILLKETLQNRLTGLNVGENATILLMFLYFPVGICTFFLGKLLYEKLELVIYQSNHKLNFTLWPIYVVIAWFLMSNMVRYVDVIFPMELFLLVYFYKNHLPDCTIQWKRSLVFIISVYSIAITFLNINTSLPKFNIPANSKVVSNFTGPNYWIPFTNKEKIFMAPAMDVGMNDKNIQQIAIDLTTKSSVDCGILKKIKFDYLIEDELKIIPSCLKLDQVDGKYRLWKIDNK